MSLPVICILNVLCTVLLVYRHTGTFMHVHTFCALLYNVKYVMLCMNAITGDGCAYVRTYVCVQVHSEFQSSKSEVLCACETAKGDCAGHRGLD